MQYRLIPFIALILFSACGTSDIANEDVMEQAPLPEVSGSRAATFTLMTLSKPGGSSHPAARPAAALGLYTTMFLTQQSIVDTASAWKGIEAQQQILKGQQSPQESETFAVLKELASILQINIADMLNRSTDREEALGQYTRSLRNILQLSDRKVQELTTLQEGLEEELKENKKIVRDLKKEIDNALDEERYEEASIKQEELAKASSALAEVEIKEEQASTIIDPFERLIEIGADRLTAIEKNDRVLIAGLKVINVPGIEDLGILEQESLFNRFTGRKDTTNTTGDRFGTVPSVMGN